MIGRGTVRQTGIAIAAMILGVQAVQACSPGFLELPYHDRPAFQRADCSYAHAEGSLGDYSGGPAVDIGGGRVAQKLNFYDHYCSDYEKLFVAICESGEAAIFEGVEDVTTSARIIGASHGEIKWIQPPYGPIALTPIAEIDDLISVAQEADIPVERLSSLSIGEGRNRVDLSCACRLFYPDTPGARQ